jgi:ubiquitin-conjugating enzyme E2 variant
MKFLAFTTGLIILNNFGLSFKNPILISKKCYTSKSLSPILNTDIVQTGSDQSSLQGAVTKTKIGSEPKFSIEGDSTIETPYQRSVVGSHFLFSLANIVISLISPNPLQPFSIALVIVLSIVLGDLATGIFHWSVDNYGTIKTPIFGSVCASFQGHHDTPWTITFRSFANNVYKICYGSIPALLLLLALHPAPAYQLFFTLFINWWVISQELHKFSHMKNPPALIASLQNLRIILSRKEHGLHHSAPFEGHYCILTGICNPLLDKTNFFRYLEMIVYRVSGSTTIVTVSGITNLFLKIVIYAAFIGNIPNTWKLDPRMKM